MGNKNKAVILIGSNIDPSVNIAKALHLLIQLTQIKSKSRIWETKSVGSDGPNFLNIAVEIETGLNPVQLNKEIIGHIEKKLKRIRTADKYAPRTIDLDIIIYEDQILDQDIWKKIFIALPVSELKPNIKNPDSLETLEQIANKLKSSEFAELFINRGC